MTKLMMKQTLTDDLTEFAKFGTTTDGGVTRLVYDNNWVKGQEYFLSHADQKQITSFIDHVGNAYLLANGAEHSEEVITIGSHMDTVVNGGNYDGIYGVTSGMQILNELIAEFGQPKKTIQVVAFCEEEGSRFPFTYTGSKFLANRLPNNVYTLVDSQGISVEEARRNAVTKLSRHYPVKIGLPPTHYFELHIEQGPVLENRQTEIGIVSAICGQKRFNLTIDGISNHAGTTPQHLRVDALQLSVKIIAQLQDYAQLIGEPLVYTTGNLEVFPNIANVVPGHVKFSIDVRHPDFTILEKFEAKIKTLLKDLEAILPAATFTLDRWTNVKPEKMSAELQKKLEALCQTENLSYLSLPSGAGHDTQIINQICSTALLFVPSVNGISHSPLEYTAPEDLERGKFLLKKAIYELAY